MAKIAITIAPTLYSRPPKTAMPGARFDYRTCEITKAALEVTAANNSILAIGVLPAGHRLNGLYLETDNLSDGADLIMDVGILNTYYNTPEANVAAGVVGFDGGTVPRLATGSVVLTDRTIVYGNILTGATICRAGGRADNVVLNLDVNVGVDPAHDRIIAVDITTEATTGKPGTIGIGALIDED